MKMITQKWTAVMFVSFFGVSTSPLWAASLESNYQPEIYFANVKGDLDKFKAHHWLGTGIDGGVGEYEFKDKDSVAGAELTMEGHGIADNADYLSDFHLKKEDIWELAARYQQFRKYYDSQGGTYRHFNALRTSDSGRDLFLDIGKLEIELTLMKPDWPKLEFGYEHEFKIGTKSLTSWGAAKENGLTRRISPTWMDIDESVDKFDVGLEKKFLGFTFDAKQTWEHVDSYSLRQTRSLTDTSTASESRVTDQELKPKSDLVRSTFHLDRWYWNEKLYSGLGYRYTQVENYEGENITQYEKTHSVFEGTERVIGATASNQGVTHSLTGSLMAVLSKTWAATAKFKAEEFVRNGQSTHLIDSTNPSDGTIDQIDVSNTSDRVHRFGEGIALRYTGFKRTALYNEIEFEQIYGGLNEDRQSRSTTEQFNRETDYYYYRFAETLGGQFYPADWVNLTAHYRFRKDLIDYDDQTETPGDATHSKSAFIDGGGYQANEFTARSTFYPFTWLQPSLRYQLRFLEYTWYIENNPLRVTPESLSNIYTASLMWHPLEPLILNGYFSVQDLWVKSPAAESSLPIPRFKANVQSWMFSADYAVNSNVSLTSNYLFQQAGNYNDFSPVSLPYGVDYERNEFSVGLKLSGLVKDAVVEPKYSYDQYNPNDDVEAGGYEAHIFWLTVKVPWG